MTVFVGLLRAVNVGGTGKLAMADLRAVAERAGFRSVRTSGASGNLVFESDLAAGAAAALLEAGLAAHAGRPIRAVLRDADDMARVLADNPFCGAPGDRVAVVFLPEAPPADALDRATGRADEEIAVGRREFYVLYHAGMGTSRLRIPAAAAGTARNLNTVARLVEAAREIEAARTGGAGVRPEAGPGPRTRSGGAGPRPTAPGGRSRGSRGA